MLVVMVSMLMSVGGGGGDCDDDHRCHMGVRDVSPSRHMHDHEPHLSVGDKDDNDGDSCQRHRR
jgi:hypothetical protein